MTFLNQIIDLIKQADDSELLKYFSLSLGIFLVLLGGLLYFHYDQVSWHTKQLRNLDKERTKTRTILRDTKIVKAQQKEVEDILAQDKDFRIGQAYQSIIQKSKLGSKIVDKKPTPRTGDTVSDKTELQITSTLRGLSMKEVTDFLLLIAQVPQLYTKDITIKKIPGRPTVDVDITVATLEQSLA